MGRDVRDAVRFALTAGAVFHNGTDPLSIFRKTLADSIRDIERDERGRLLQRFLRDGPCEIQGPTPPELRGKRLTEEETSRAITFIYSFMVNSFKGGVTELLAAAACQRLMRDPRLAGMLPPSARLHVGDAVMVPREARSGGLKGADLHVLVAGDRYPGHPLVTVAGVAEVKSGRKSAAAMGGQLARHIRRAAGGLIVSGEAIPAGRLRLGLGTEKRILRITVQPSDWPLPRVLRFEAKGDGVRELVLDPPVPPTDEDLFVPMGDDRWHVTLRWSMEAIAAAAYEMTFWYMEKVGEVIYAAPEAKPKDWGEMTPSDAGRNAIKMMLYYAIRRFASGSRTEQRAIALYNTYGFGYALGMNYRNPAGRREMLWPRDLDEIARDGRSRDGCRIVG